MRPEFAPWSLPPAQLVLAPGTIDLWRADLDRTAPDEHLLSVDERARAHRLLSPEKARRFAAGRTLLRRLLARYLEHPPQTLIFSNGIHGKPFLPDSPGLEFNLAHSGNILLLAVGRGAPLGVDVERIDPDLDWRCVASRYLAPAAVERLAKVAIWRQRRLFYRFWTRQEAVLKGAGGGFRTPQESAILLSGWQTYSLWVARSTLGAVSFTGRVRWVRRFDGPEWTTP